MIRPRQVRHLLTPKRLIAGLILVFLVILGVWQPLSAQSVTQGYSTDEKIQTGMIVKQKANDATKVAIASYADSDKILGIIVNANDAPVTISTEGSTVFVANSGRYQVLVSDENGAIKTGDYLTISHTDGIAMKAGSSDPLSIGKALEDFGSKSEVLATIKNNGKIVHIGRIRTDIAIGVNPLLIKEKNSVPAFLQSASQTLTNKVVQPVRLYIALIMLVLTVIISGSMLYAGVRSSITAIGRNPLSKRDIRKSLLQVTGTSIIVFIIGVFAVYLLLKL